VPEIVLSILEQYPALIYVLLGGMCLFVMTAGSVALWGLWRGRAVKIPGVSVGPEVHKEVPPAPPAPEILPVSVTATSTATATANPSQSQTVNVLAEIKPENFPELADQIAARVQEIKVEQPQPTPVPASDLPALSDDLGYVLRAQLEMRNRVAEVVLAWGGGWAGHSLWSLGGYTNLAEEHRLISGQLSADITQFMHLTATVFSGGSTGGYDVEDARTLATHKSEPNS
jgi:hypothetical protein